MSVASARLPLRWRVAGFLAIAGALNYADRAAMSSVLAPLRTELHLSDVALGLIGSVFLWSYALGSSCAGLLADRYSRRRLIVLSLGLWSIVTALTGAAGGLVSLLLLRCSLGLSESLYLPAAVGLLADHHGAATRGRAMGLHNVGLNLGVVAGGAASGYLADHFGWRAGFFVLGGIGVGLALLSGIFVQDAPTTVKAAAVRPGVGETFMYLVRIPTYLVFLAKVMLVGISTWIFLNWLPLYFRESFKMNLGEAGFAGTFMLQIAMVMGYAAGGWLSDKIAARSPPRRMLLQAVFFFTAAPFLLLFLSEPGLRAVVVAISAFSLFRGLGQANELPILCDIVPNRYRSTAVALMNTCGTAAGGLGTVVAGMLKRDFGLNTVFAGISVIFVAAAALLMLAYWRWFESDLERARVFEAASLPAPDHARAS